MQSCCVIALVLIAPLRVTAWTAGGRVGHRRGTSPPSTICRSAPGPEEVAQQVVGVVKARAALKVAMELDTPAPRALPDGSLEAARSLDSPESLPWPTTDDNRPSFRFGRTAGIKQGSRSKDPMDDVADGLSEVGEIGASSFAFAWWQLTSWARVKGGPETVALSLALFAVLCNAGHFGSAPSRFENLDATGLSGVTNAADYLIDAS